MKYGNLNLLEPSGQLQACNGTGLPYLIMPANGRWDFIRRLNVNISLKVEVLMFAGRGEGMLKWCTGEF